MGWFWFDMSRKTTTEQKLVNTAGIVEREVRLWLKERNYDLRVFANYFVILDNLLKYNAEINNNGPSPEAKSQGYISIYHKISDASSKSVSVLSPACFVGQEWWDDCRL